VFIDYSFRLAH